MAEALAELMGGLPPPPPATATEKLRYQLKKEKKGAIRELRKDNRFLSKVRLQEVLENDADRNKKLNRAMNLIQSEASGLKEPRRK
jgi:nucleolar protein 14